MVRAMVTGVDEVLYRHNDRVTILVASSIHGRGLSPYNFSVCQETPQWQQGKTLSGAL